MNLRPYQRKALEEILSNEFEQIAQLFFVIRYKDKYAYQALTAYADAVRSDAEDLLDAAASIRVSKGEDDPEAIEKQSRGVELMEFADEMDAEASIAFEYLNNGDAKQLD